MASPIVQVTDFPRSIKDAKKDQKYFSKTADNVNWRNGWSNPMRGGYRL